MSYADAIKEIDWRIEDAPGLPREEPSTPTRTEARAHLREVRPPRKGFRKAKLALPRPPQSESHTPDQSAVLRPKHRVMEVMLIVVLLALVAVTMKGDDR